MKKIFVLAALCIAGYVSAPAQTPLIGVSPCGNEKNYNVNSPMFTSVFRAGGVPMMLPMVRSAEEAELLAEKIDGLIMVGGEDINPSYYGETVLNETVEINGFRDTSDFYLINAARKKGIPILGICRGEQILNIACGGSLYQDIPSQLGEHVADSVHHHWIFVEKDTRLHELLGVDSIIVNSYHHQSVKTPGKGLAISAHAHDGVVEAYEGEEIFAVQFHPEHFVASGDTVFLPIFRDLIDRARK